MASRKRHDVIELLKALRAAGVTCSTITVGGVTVDGIVWLASEDGPAKKPEPRVSLWDSNVEAIRNMPASPSMDVPPETLIE